VAKKICESLKATASSRWSNVGHIFGIPAASSELTSLVCRVQEKLTESNVGHIFGIPAASSELTSLVCRVQEKLTEEAIHSIHSNSTAKSTNTDQDGDFVEELKKLKQEQHDTKRELDRLKQLCVKHQIDTSTRKQKEERTGEQCATKGGRAANRVPVASTTPPAVDDTAAGADA
jgi:hypothetical protein